MTHDTITSARALMPKKPGRLKGEVTLTLHTAYPQKLLLGFGEDKRSINLLQFSHRMGEMWDAAARDDPYADWYLLKIYDLSTKLRKHLIADIEKYHTQLNQMNQNTQFVQLNITPFASERPVTESLWFKTQYGYLAANLIAHFDELMRVVLTAYRVGVLLDSSEVAIRQTWLDKLLALFRLPFHWKPCSITRADIKANNEQAKKAKQKMGTLPAPLLSLQLRSPFAPIIKPVLDNTS